MDEDQLYLEDWRMTKDRIKHFDDMLVRIRVGAFPIATALLGAGFLALQYVSDVKVFDIISAASMLFLASAGYLIPIALLDFFHYKLLKIAVDHARDLERNVFKEKMQITTKLTKHWLTNLHTGAFFVLYGSFTIVAVLLAVGFQ